MSLINAAIKLYLQPRIGRIEHAVNNPHKVQEDLLRYLLHVSRNTEWGKQYGYASIKNAKEFAAQVPVQNYDTLKPYILRNYNGEQNVLWPSHIKWFSKSSGTTEDRSKFIPVSKQSLTYTHYRSGKDIMALYMRNHPKEKLFDGKGLVLTGSVSPNADNNKAFSGDVSGVLIQNLDRWVHYFRTPHKSIALIPTWEEKIDLVVAATRNVNVTYISGVPSWMLVLVNRMLETTGKTDLREIWPNLKLFIHGAVNFEPYKDQFNRLIPHSDMNYYETYNASEGFFALQDQDDSGDMLLMMDYGIYYEFMPFDEVGSDNPHTVTLKDVELDRNYALIISSNSGLWRYMIGDTIKFTSLNPFRIAITGRTKHFINAFGEELVVENAEKALAFASKETDALVNEYTVAPVYLKGKEAGSHEWLIEFDTPPNDTDKFTHTLDQKLMELNSDYEAKRKGNMTLAKPIIRFLPAHTFYNWMKKRGKLGGQHKVPRLSNDRKYADDIKREAGLNIE